MTFQKKNLPKQAYKYLLLFTQILKVLRRYYNCVTLVQAKAELGFILSHHKVLHFWKSNIFFLPTGILIIDQT